MNYPVKSNWISYKRSRRDGSYRVENHLSMEFYIMTREEIEFVNCLDGYVDPYDILINDFGYSRRMAEFYLMELRDEGIIRYDNKIDGMPLMRTLIKIYNSKKYKRISVILTLALLLGFIPMLTLAVFSWNSIRRDCIYFEFDAASIQYWMGFLFGISAGLIIHEIAHATSCIAFNGKVMEFGVMFRGFPAAYTMMDTDMISFRMGKIITDLAGVMTNIVLASGSIFLASLLTDYVTFFGTVALLNVELALVNLLMASGLDGYNAMEQILGMECIVESGKSFIKRYKAIKKLLRVSESERAFVPVIYIMRATKLIYPGLILFNICMVFGW